MFQHNSRQNATLVQNLKICRTAKESLTGHFVTLDPCSNKTPMFIFFNFKKKNSKIDEHRDYHTK